MQAAGSRGAHWHARKHGSAAVPREATKMRQGTGLVTWR